MKQLFTLLTCIILFTTCKPKDPTPSIITGLDPNFEKYLVDKKIDKDGKINGQMNSADAIGVESLEIRGLQIKSLAGIEKFVDLKSLICQENQLSNLDVSKNLNLKYLHCQRNLIKTICVNDLNKASTNSTTKGINGYNYWEKDPATSFAICK
jgi:Leucine-rich repeat (LRR) protein